MATELFGAYGWRLSLDEAKWLTDWHLARGNNLFVPHACFYSVRGGRAFESEPDVALHNPWWAHFQDLLGYTRRMSWLLTDGEQVCAVAVAGVGHHLGWEAARRLYEAQIDFLYVDAAGLAAAALDADGRLCVGAQRYRAVVLEPDFTPTPEGAALVRAFARRGARCCGRRSKRRTWHGCGRSADRTSRSPPRPPGCGCSTSAGTDWTSTPCSTKARRRSRGSSRWRRRAGAA